jgi:hypothetical protein
MREHVEPLMDPESDWKEPDVTELKVKLNTLIWEIAHPDTTLRELEGAAGAAFEAIWKVCQPPLAKRVGGA